MTPHPEDPSNAKPFHAMNKQERKAHNKKTMADRRAQPLGRGTPPKKGK
jgi:hypothetical protein